MWERVKDTRARWEQWSSNSKNMGRAAKEKADRVMNEVEAVLKALVKKHKNMRAELKHARSVAAGVAQLTETLAQVERTVGVLADNDRGEVRETSASVITNDHLAASLAMLEPMFKGHIDDRFEQMAAKIAGVERVGAAADRRVNALTEELKSVGRKIDIVNTKIRQSESQPSTSGVTGIPGVTISNEEAKKEMREAAELKKREQQIQQQARLADKEEQLMKQLQGIIAQKEKLKAKVKFQDTVQGQVQPNMNKRPRDETSEEESDVSQFHKQPRTTDYDTEGDTTDNHQGRRGRVRKSRVDEKGWGVKYSPSTAQGGNPRILRPVIQYGSEGDSPYWECDR